MKDLLDKLRQHLSKEDTRKYLHFMAIPLVAILLIAVIVVADKPKAEIAGPVPESEMTLADGSHEELETDVAASPIQEIKKDGIPEINELMETYLKAKKSCDRETLSQVYAGTCTAEQLDLKLSRMEEEVKYYQDFRNLTCYTVPGLTDNSWVVYACFDIKFRQAETMSPTMAACYVKKSSEGIYYLENSTSEEEAAYIQKVNESEAVQQLAKDVNSRLRTALESDSNLLSVYYTLTGQKDNPESQAANADQTEEPGESAQTAE